MNNEPTHQELESSRSPDLGDAIASLFGGDLVTITVVPRGLAMPIEFDVQIKAFPDGQQHG